MSERTQPSTPADRDRAHSRLRILTRGAIVAATGATLALGVVVAHDRPGAKAVGTSANATSSSSKSTAVTKIGNSSSGTTSDSSDSGTTGTTGNTGTTSSSSTATRTTTPTKSSSSATVTSGATS